eukprot:CAMPEP_0119353754 /NCGR_PEP_ID=MMETSP1334-20130426/2853_1 /TAXON_ID=127549 /ORGANISM="Calcidiscus leptoporus, Strain RCC1130" /LENGTH=636 /DNA_ID=CAMNT_0007367119 /DNA_START=24 /DNA_END=1934 /DNA_ORIENTATION=-
MVALTLWFAVAGAAAQELTGHLTVCAIQADSLEDMDADEWFGGGASDPYVTVQVGSESCSSVVLRDHSTAVWNHCCSFGLVPESEPIHVVVTDMDDHGDDDLIGLACTSVHSGTRWLDLIRHDTYGIVGSVQLQVIFELDGGASPSGVSRWQSVNGTAGSAEAHCPADYLLTDCVCLAADFGSQKCGGLSYATVQGRASCRLAAAPGALDIVGARCWQPPTSLRATVHTETSAATPAQVDSVAVAQCTMGSTVVGCSAAVPRGEKLPKSVKFEQGACAAVSDGSAVSSSARCASTAGAEVAFSINHWTYQSVSHMDKPTVAYCPDRFELSGCACFSEDARMCSGAAFTSDGGCTATMFTGGNILQVLRNTVRGQKGIFAQARCMWSGPSERLLMLSASDGAAAQSTACSTLADADAQFERERESFVTDLSRQTGYNWSAQSGAWWARQGERYDFTKSVNDVRNHPTTQAIQELMEGFGVSLPSSMPEDGLPVQAPVSALKEAVSQLPWSNMQDVKARVTELIKSRGGSHDRAKDRTSSSTRGDEPAASAGAGDQPEPPPTAGGADSGGGAGAFFGGVAATVALLAAALGGFIFYQRHKERGLMNRRFLSQDLTSSSAGTFNPPSIVVSPLQTGGAV